ncbi:yjiA, partial [Symbiodinium necroappetens]
MRRGCGCKSPTWQRGTWDYSKESFEHSLELTATVEEAAGSMQPGSKVDLAGLWATRADILMGLGGLRRAAGELRAAALLAPEDVRVKDLLAECEKLQQYQEEGFAEDAAAAAQSKVPVHILTGFLGSGKTTLLNHILRESHTKRYAVIENEFGEIGIDDKLIARRENLGAEQIIEMNNGCICCT